MQETEFECAVAFKSYRANITIFTAPTTFCEEHEIEKTSVQLLSLELSQNFLRSFLAREILA